jgi:hypothetical protein
MTLGFGTCMNVFDDLDPTGAMASGITVLVNDTYHLIITERGTVATNPDFGFGVTEELLSGLLDEDIPALADEIEAAILDDDRVSDSTITIARQDDVLVMDVYVLAATEPPEGFRLVGPLSDLRAEILAQVT